MARQRRRPGSGTPSKDLRGMQVDADEAALDADPGSMDQAAPAG